MSRGTRTNKRGAQKKESLYILNDLENPIRKARGKVSRRNFADFADVDPTLVTRTELGMTNSVAPSIVRAAAYMAGQGNPSKIIDHDGGLTEPEFLIVDAWHTWQYERRSMVHYEIEGEDLYPYKIKDWTANTFRIIADRIIGSGTDYAVARVFSIHPETWSQYLERGGAPTGVLASLVEDVRFHD